MQRMKLKDIIDKFISGDWGQEVPVDDATNAVYCVRGADIVPISNTSYDDIPQRFITDKSFTNRLLNSGDLVIEKSGGSPTQSTGRISYLSSDLILKKSKIVCSNFCVAFRVKTEKWNPKFIYYYWQYIYNQGVFFNFEGKTSGLKNLQLDNALAAIDVPEISLADQGSIVDCLDRISDKIALNREINRNLPLAS